MTKVFVTVGQASKGQVALGAALTRTTAKQMQKETILESQIVSLDLDGDVKPGQNLYPVISVEEDGERIFDFLSLTAPAGVTHYGSLVLRK